MNGRNAGAFWSIGQPSSGARITAWPRLLIGNSSVIALHDGEGIGVKGGHLSGRSRKRSGTLALYAIPRRAAKRAGPRVYGGLP